MEIFALSLFCLALVTCIVFGQPLWIALGIGFCIFSIYGLRRGYNIREILGAGFSGILAVKNIALVMLLIGALTALWRASGTIATIVYYSAGALQPTVFLPVTFALCSIVSVLTGTSLGTAATMGVICMSVGNALGIDPMFLGGAILAGSFFGDRCSPVSTSALLVAEITHTSIYNNIRGMIRTGMIPLAISICIYFCIGFFARTNGVVLDVAEIFEKHYTLHWVTILPAVSILALTAFRVNIKITMLVSIAVSFALCVWLQKISVLDTAMISFFGFKAPGEISGMLSGGGVLGMMNMIFIVLITLTYPGIFKCTGMLDKIHKRIEQISTRVSPFACTVLTAIATCALSCNQSLSIVLTNELSSKIIPDNNERALAIENTSVVIAAIVPWTVAFLIPIHTIGAPKTSAIFACYLWLLPIVEIIRKKRKR